MSLKRKAAGAVTPEADPELNCVICLNLVLNATQSNCCGSTFCRTCIHEWLEQRDACPACRGNIREADDIVPDFRTDRKSSHQSRPCKYHDDHGCEFTGTRQEVADHEHECPNVPLHVVRQEMRKVEKQKSDLEIEVAALKSEMAEVRDGLETMNAILIKWQKLEMDETTKAILINALALLRA